MPVNELWYSKDEAAWTRALAQYMSYVRPANIELEQEMERLDLNWMRQLDAQGWYDFLYHKYFVWKYTAPNRLATTRLHLSKYVEFGTLNDLLHVKEQLLSFSPEDIKQGLQLASSIRGLGIAGASGLLSLMYPTHFATVDQFVVKALLEINNLPYHAALARMNPEGLVLADGIFLSQIMQRKAVENNHAFNTDTWTPRKIDKILWSYGR